ncbi:spore cortex biosynthesis protein YabQ [Paenibacillus tuaregi]|uniref:spore cortex biosynthesis protein YabQ n=1 Tax=Paenibacillus tuaregi TaxID=1816681 RepID=UPI000838D88B|nr:spore cortex biosynthesis protein YabQ [Paenibacillus tuaregi]
MNLHVQWVTLLWMLVSGGIMGVAFDSYRVVSGQLRFPRWSVHALDLVYWAAASVFVFRMLYLSNQGQLRFYVFLGLFLGIWIYFLFLSVITERFVVMLMVVTRRIYAFMVRLFQLLILAPIRILWKGIKLVFGFAWVVLLFLGRITLLPIWRILRWMFMPFLRRLHIPEVASKLKARAIGLWNRWFTKN